MNIISLPHDLTILHLRKKQSDTGAPLSFYYKKGNKIYDDTGKCIRHCICCLILF